MVLVSAEYMSPVWLKIRASWPSGELWVVVSPGRDRDRKSRRTEDIGGGGVGLGWIGLDCWMCVMYGECEQKTSCLFSSVCGQALRRMRRAMDARVGTVPTRNEAADG